MHSSRCVLPTRLAHSVLAAVVLLAAPVAAWAGNQQTTAPLSSPEARKDPSSVVSNLRMYHRTGRRVDPRKVGGFGQSLSEGRDTTITTRFISRPGIKIVKANIEGTGAYNNHPVHVGTITLTHVERTGKTYLRINDHETFRVLAEVDGEAAHTLLQGVEPHSEVSTEDKQGTKFHAYWAGGTPTMVQTVPYSSDFTEYLSNRGVSAWPDHRISEDDAKSRIHEMTGHTRGLLDLVEKARNTIHGSQ